MPSARAARRRDGTIARMSSDVPLVLRLVIADDMEKERAWYEHSLDQRYFELVGSFENGETLLHGLDVEAGPTTVVLLDGKMPSGSADTRISHQRNKQLRDDQRLAGLETARALRKRRHDQVLLIGTNDPDSEVAAGVQELGGPAGYILKDSITTFATLHEIFSRLMTTQEPLFDPVTAPLLGIEAMRARLRKLTPGEDKVFGLLADGKSTKEISDQLSLSPATVSERLTAIYHKLGLAKELNKRSAAVREFYRLAWQPRKD